LYEKTGIKEICRKPLRLPKNKDKENKIRNLDAKMLVGLLLILVFAAHQTLANEVVKLLHGDVSSSVDHDSGGKKLILAGREVVVECAGQWRQEVKITASLLTDGRHTFDLERERKGRSGGEEFKFSPRVEDFSQNTQIQCEVHWYRNTTGIQELLSSDTLDVIIVFPPQPNKDHFVAVEKVGVRGEAKVILKAWPLVQKSTLEWETPKTFQDSITTTSNEAGYQLTARKVSESELEVQLVVERITQEDLGRHILTLENQLGEETYKVFFFEPKVAQVFISPLPKEIVIGGKTNTVRCTSDGGVPPPTALEASVEVRGLQVRQLIPVGNLEKRGEHLEQEFKLDPRVSERTDSDTFAVCKADQEVDGTLAGGDNAHQGVPAQEQMNIFYPPQPQSKIYAYANVDEPAMATLMVQAYPSPREEDIKWSFAESEREKYKLEVVYIDTSTVKLTLSVVKVEEFDFSIKHEVHVENKYGKEVYHFEVVKPTPAWVIVLIVLGCLLLLAAIIAIPTVVATRKRSRGAALTSSQSKPEPSTTDTKTPFLAESTA